MSLSVIQYAQSFYEATREVKNEDLEEVVAEFVKLLVADKATTLVPEIMVDFSEIWNKENGIAELLITSAKEISETQMAELKKKALESTGAKSVVVKKNIDPEILGGLIVRVGDRIFDASLKERLAQLQKALVKKK